MHIIAKSTLRVFWERHPRSEAPLMAWFETVRRASWKTPQDVKSAFGTTVDFLPRNRVIFDIAGNHYRLVVLFAYRAQRVYIRFVGTHADYDRIDPENI